MGLYLLIFFDGRSSCWCDGWARGKVCAIYAIGVEYDSCWRFVFRERETHSLSLSEVQRDSVYFAEANGHSKIQRVPIYVCEQGIKK